MLLQDSILNASRLASMVLMTAALGTAGYAQTPGYDDSAVPQDGSGGGLTITPERGGALDDLGSSARGGGLTVDADSRGALEDVSGDAVAYGNRGLATGVWIAPAGGAGSFVAELDNLGGGQDYRLTAQLSEWDMVPVGYRMGGIHGELNPTVLAPVPVHDGSFHQILPQIDVVGTWSIAPSGIGRINAAAWLHTGDPEKPLLMVGRVEGRLDYPDDVLPGDGSGAKSGLTISVGGAATFGDYGETTHGNKIVCPRGYQLTIQGMKKAAANYGDASSSDVPQGGSGATGSVVDQGEHGSSETWGDTDVGGDSGADEDLRIFSGRWVLDI